MKARHSLLAAALLGAALAANAADTLFVDADVVRQVQKTLADRGYRSGGADGRMGPQTQAAVKRFQRAEKLEPTGQLNRQTLVALGIQKDATARADDPRYDRETIRAVQQTLNNRGFKAGPVDGILSERTHLAIKQFQKSENLEDTGRLNERTLAHLGVGEPSASVGASRPLGYNEAAIRAIQSRLKERGYAVAVDGVLGQDTRAALEEFQRTERLSVTGRPNRQTIAALGLEGRLN